VQELPDIPQDAFERRLFELAGDALVVCEINGTIRRANPAAAKLLLGDERARPSGVLWDCVHPDDLAAVRPIFSEVGPDGSVRDEEFRVRILRPGGEVRLAEVRAVVDHQAGLCHLVGRDATRRAEGEAKLAEAQQLAHLGSWEWLIEADEVTWSDELFRIHGLRPRPGTQRWEGHLERVHRDDRARVARAVEQCVKDAGSWSIDHRIVRPDGEVRMVHARGEAIAGEDGTAVAVHGTCQDVTEARRVEDALRATEQLFRRAFDDSPIGMALIDLEGRWLRLNRALAQLAGRTEPDLRSTTLAALSHPDDAELDRPLTRELLAGRRRSYAIEKRMMHADGRVLHLLVHVSLMHGDGERPLYFLVQLIDLSERRRAEAERRAGEQRLQAIIDNAPALISVKDARQRFLLVNRRFEQAIGVEAETVLGRTAAEALPAARVDPADDELEREVVRTGHPLSREATISAADGAEQELHVVKFPLLDTEGHISAVCTIATDLTESRRAERQAAELEQRLAQAQRLESVGQLAGGVAHDFNNLLSVIISCVTFAREQLDESSPVRADVEEIGRAAERAAALTRQLLMFSRREVVRPEVIDVGALVTDLESLLSRSLGELVDLRIECDADLPHVLVDRSRLEQVLVNLAVNGRDAMPHGGTLTVTVARAGEGIAVSVADEGTGMAPEVADRAFEPFFTTKPAGEGTGLGLATVHGIVTGSGGQVAIDTAPGRGTDVTFTLPPAGEEPPVPSVPDALPAHAVACSARVLVVEDQDPVRRQAVRMLRAHGYEVCDAAGGDEALASWEAVDVLVTDVVMPGMSGHELARRVTELAPGLPIVFMSGHTEDVVLLDGAREREIHFVQKPFTRDALLGAVARALAESRSRAAGDAAA